jgi:hypothetical protein
MDHALATPEGVEYRSDRAGTDHPPPTRSYKKPRPALLSLGGRSRKE